MRERKANNPQPQRSTLPGSPTSGSRQRGPRGRWRRWRAGAERRHHLRRRGPRVDLGARRHRRRLAREQARALHRSRWSLAMERRTERRLARGERRAGARLATRRRHTERPGLAERIETRLARRARVDQWRARLPYLSWHKELFRPPTMPYWEIAAAGVVGIAAGLGVAASGASPTGARSTDIAWSLVLGVVVATAGTLARRRVLLLAAAVATVGAWGWWSVGGLVALVLASGVVYQRDGVITGERLLHALSASLALQALVRMPGWSWMRFGTTALVAAVAIGAVLMSGWWRSPRRVRSGVAVAVAAGMIALAVMGTSLWRLVDGVSLTEGTSLAADGTTASLDDLALSAEDLTSAEQRLDSVQRRLNNPLLAPLRFVPLAAQQVRAIDTTIDVGLDLAGRAGDGAALVEGSELRPAPGQVDVVAVRALEAPLQAMVDSLQSAEVELASVQTPWLAGPIKRANRRLADASTGALPSTGLALLGVQTVPGMLGADGPRRWLIQLIDTENGTEEWQVVVADNGRLIPTDEVGGGDGVGVRIGDLSTNPDYPTAAQAAAERYEAETGRPIDGVMTMDSSAASAVAISLGGSPSVSQPSLKSILGLSVTAVPASPGNLERSASAEASEKRILIWTKQTAEQGMLEALGLTGSLRSNSGTEELLYVGILPEDGIAASTGIAKEISSRSALDITTGELRTETTLRLRNAGRSDLDTTLTIATGMRSVEVQIAGVAQTPTSRDSNGWKLLTIPLMVRAGGETEVRWSAVGTVDPLRYSFVWQPQPLFSGPQLAWDFSWHRGESDYRYSEMIRSEDARLPVRQTVRVFG